MGWSIGISTFFCILCQKNWRTIMQARDYPNPSGLRIRTVFTPCFPDKMPPWRYPSPPAANCLKKKPTWVSSLEKHMLHDPLNAFCTHPQFALPGAPDGPLKGLCFAVKDVFELAGSTYGAGNPDWLNTHAPAASTAPAVRLLLDAGASMAGITHTDELTYSLNGENAHHGTPVNPNAPGRIPGGSSSGSASAVAGKLVDFALGTDCAGSVRLPASYCGIFGMRPSHGQVSTQGVFPLARSIDTVGWFSVTAEVLEKVGKVLLTDSAPAAATGPLLIASDGFELAGADVAGALAKGLARVKKLLPESRDIRLSSEPLSVWMETFRLIQGAEVWAEHGDWVTRTNPHFGPGIRERFKLASELDPAAVARAMHKRLEIAQQMDVLLQNGKVLCLPSAPGIAPFKNTPPAELEGFRARAISLLCAAGLCGLPQVSIPLGTLNGCPIGLSLIMRRGSDLSLMALVRRLFD